MVFRAACILRHRIHEYTVKFRRRVEADNLPPRLDALLPSISEAPIYFPPGRTSGSQHHLFPNHNRDVSRQETIPESVRLRCQRRWIFARGPCQVHPTAFLTPHDFCAERGHAPRLLDHDVLHVAGKS
jgi:hypothetical protein